MSESSISTLQQELQNAFAKSTSATRAYQDALAKIDPLRIKEEEAKKNVVLLMRSLEHAMGLGEAPTPERKKRKKRDRPCPTCGFRTDPPHDKRQHRKHPESFTEKELAAFDPPMKRLPKP